jgi:hypothetical protein
VNTDPEDCLQISGGSHLQVNKASVIHPREFTEGKCTAGCDNKGALVASFGWKYPTPRWASYDLVRMIRHHLALLPIQWEGQYVKGHQEDSTKEEELDKWALANILAYTNATQELQ